MASILCLTTGLVGMTYATLELSRRLVADGHRLVFSAALDVEAYARAAEVEWAPIEPLVLDPAPEVAAPGRVARKWREWTTRAERQAVAAGRIRASLAPFEALLERGAFDLVLVDVELAEHVFALVARGQRFALLTPWFETQKRAGLPPIDSRSIPGVGFDGSRLGMAAQWAKARARRRARRALVWARYFGTDRRSALVPAARDAGLSPSMLRPDDWVTDFGLEGLPTLRMTLPSLEFEHRARPEVDVVGPMVLPDEYRPGERAASDRLRRALDQWQATDTGQPVVYAAASSKSRVAGEFLARVVRACQGRDVRLVVGAGGDAQARDRSVAAAGRSESVHVELHAPALVALEGAALALHHAGIHSVNEALASGTRQLAYSGREADQDGTAARLARRGVARLGDRREGEQALGARIVAALEDQALAVAARDARAAVDRSRADRLLETAVERLIGARPWSR